MSYSCFVCFHENKIIVSLNYRLTGLDDHSPLNLAAPKYVSPVNSAERKSAVPVNLVESKYTSDNLAESKFASLENSAEPPDKEAHYFIFFTHMSQYFSIREAPSTWNKAS